MCVFFSSVCSTLLRSRLVPFWPDQLVAWDTLQVWCKPMLNNIYTLSMMHVAVNINLFLSSVVFLCLSRLRLCYSC